MKKITNLEFGSIIYFIIRAYFVGVSLNALLFISKQDNWISILFGIIIGIIPLLLYIYIFNYEPDLDINKKNIKLFGKTIGNILNITIVFFTLILITTIFGNLVTIIHGDYLSKTPVLFITITFMIAIFYPCTKDINSIARSCLIFFYASIFLVLISNIGLLVQLDVNNFKPIFFYKLDTIKGTFTYISFNTLPLYLINIIPKNKIKNNNKTTKNILIFYVLANISLLVVSICIIGILGIKMAILYQHPEFQILKHIAIIGLSSRLDSILFIQWIIDILIFIIIGLYYVVNTTHIFINEKKNICLFIYCFIISIVTLFITNNIFLNTLIAKKMPFIITITTIFFTILICLKIKHTKKIKR